MKSPKLKAGALQLATMISIVVALMLAAFILLVFTQNKFLKDTGISSKLMKLSRDGVFYVQQKKELSYDINTNIDLGYNEKALLYVKKQHWGIYDIVNTRATYKNKSHSKNALLGAVLNNEKKPALYLKNVDKPLVVSGSTRINGIAYLSSQGVKAGNISGNYYSGTKLIYGKRYVSKPLLPEISSDKRSYFKNILESSLKIPDSLFVSNNSTSNSFAQNTKWIIEDNEVVLDNIKLKGNIIVKSNKKIIVTKKAQLDQIILIAPEVEVREYFKGAIQIIANKKILIRSNTHFKYPSSIVYKGKDKLNDTIEEELGVVLEKKVQFYGSIIDLGSCDQSRICTVIKIGDDSDIKGEIYSDNSIELKGDVTGSIYTSGFLSKYKGTNYINHLFNVNIDGESLPQIFAGIQLEGFNKSVAMWVE